MRALVEFCLICSFVVSLCWGLWGKHENVNLQGPRSCAARIAGNKFSVNCVPSERKVLYVDAGRSGHLVLSSLCGDSALNAPRT
jgi:hypothetical protein